MEVKLIKNELEKYYYIGFDVIENSNMVYISPKGSRKETFQVALENRNNIRLVLTAEPHKYGANFLKLISTSTKQKRINCCSVKKNADIYINSIKIEDEDFINYSGNWGSFKITTEIIPFISNNNVQIIEKIKTLISAILSLVDYSIEGYEEGNKTKIESQKYERNPINRQICLNAKGYKCVCCGFDFEKVYGPVGKETIEVHHTTPVSQMGEGYVVDPIKELEPVCPNCHTIIHKKDIPYTIEEVKEMLKGA